MDLEPGAKLGPYEILAPIGAGGMGKVYKARDTRLDRIVAIKVSHEEFSPRFEQEARAVAALNHPQICTLHDVGPNYLVMEYLEGDTLAARLAKGPLRLNGALSLAIQIADALDAAHRKGIVHRDLKPANVMLTKSGAKLLDFGLARMKSTEHPSSENVTVAMTNPGTILGTFQYMSPEQLEAKDADARSDIFAFGAVLYEMLTGRRAFEGKSQASLISAILSAEPAPLATLQPMLPTSLDRVVRKCLAKDPDKRWQTANDLTDELRWVAEGGSQGQAPAGMPAAGRPHQWRWIATVTLLALAIPAAWFLKPKPPAPEQPLLEMKITAPDGAAFRSFNPGQVALSPDGRRLVFVAAGKDGKRMLWTKLLASDGVSALPGTENATAPFFAPDSRSIGFFASGTLQKLDLAGGQPQFLCAVNGGTAVAASWNSEGVILFSDSLKPLHRVSASGGEATPVLALDARRGETQQLVPFFLPDNQHFLYGSFARENGIALGSLDGTIHQLLLPLISPVATYAPNPAGGGWLLYTVDRQLLARPLDAGKRQFTGEAAVVTEPLSFGLSWSVSGNGLLAFRRLPSSQTQLTWLDRHGKQLGIAGNAGELSSPRISPDQKFIAFCRSEGRNASIWLLDIARETANRFTFEPGLNTDPVWSPDGSRIVFASWRQNEGLLVERAADGIGPEIILKREAGYNLRPSAISRMDGRLVVSETSGPINRMLLVSPGDSKSVPFPGPVQALLGSLSPDERWMLYSSRQAGGAEVFVQSLPKEAGGSSNVAGKFQISTTGGTTPVWRADGKEIFYVAPDGKMMAVPIELGLNVFRPGSPKPLFQTGIYPDLYREYDVTPDGQRFLINQRTTETGAPPITVIVNWPKLLQK